MTKQELITVIGRNFLKAKNKTERDASATFALNGIDTNSPFVFAAVDSSTVVCLQPSGKKGIDELNEILEGAKKRNSSVWYYYNPKSGVCRTTHLCVVQSIEEFIKRRGERK